MTITKDLAYQHVLCMELNATLFKFAIVHRETKKIIDFKEFELANFERSALEAILKQELCGLRKKIGLQKNRLEKKLACKK